MSDIVLKLYVTDQTPNSRRSIASVQELCDEELSGRYELEVIDILETPHLADAENVVATPTLVKQTPGPLRRVVGDLSSKENVLAGLNIKSAD
ncbi:MAG: circadian clock KaiB family protein [Thermodesulfobacteriota bacterium]